MISLYLLKRIISQVLTDFSVFGSFVFHVFFAILLFILGFTGEGLLLGIGLFVLILIISPIRLMFFRVRPHKVPFTSILSKIDASSFPSMHMARMGLLVSLGVAPLLFVSISLCVALSRHHLKKHYWSDIVVGFVLGLIVGYALQVLVSLLF